MAVENRPADPTWLPGLWQKTGSLTTISQVRIQPGSGCKASPERQPNRSPETIMRSSEVITLTRREDLTDEIRQRIRSQELDTLIIDYPLTTDGDMITTSPLAFSSEITEFRFRIILGTGCTSADKMFFGCSSLEKAPPLDLSHVQSLDWMFEDCKNLTTVPPYHAPEAVSARGMFRHCRSLTSFPGIRLPDNVQAEGITQGCSALESVPAIRSPRIILDCPEDVTDVVRLRTAAQDLEELVINFNLERKLLFGQFTRSNSPLSGLAGLDRIRFRITLGPECRSLEGLFCGCSGLKEAPPMDTARIRNMNFLFQDCVSLISVPLYDTSGCTSMRNTFRGCAALTSLPCFDTARAETMFGMLEGCSSLRKIPRLDTGRVRDFSWFLSCCTTLEEIPHLDTSSAETMCGMFNRCTALRKLPHLSVRSLRDPDKLFSGYPRQDAAKAFWGFLGWRRRLPLLLGKFRKGNPDPKSPPGNIPGTHPDSRS